MADTHANPIYQITGESVTGVVPNYGVFTTEVVLRNEFELLWLGSTPFLAMIKDGSLGWNKGASVNGSALLIPVDTDDAAVAAVGVANADELTPLTFPATNGATQAMFQIAHYQHNFTVRRSEKRKINNARGNFMDYKVKKLMASFTETIANDLSNTTTADSEAKLVGVQQVLATTNTVGRIAQTSTSWASNLETGVGTFTLDCLNTGMAAARARRGKISHIALASTTYYLWDKLHDTLSVQERVVNQAFSGKFGFTSIMYRGATCFEDTVMTAGVICGFDSSTWFYAGDEKPVAAPIERIQGTGAEEHYYDMFCGVGCSNPGKNFRKTGVS